MKALLVIFVAVLLFPACSDKEPVIDLWTAAAAGNVDVVEAHVKFGTDLDAQEPLGGSNPLIIASLFGHVAVIETLLDAGAQLDIQNNEGSTALHTAAFFCHKEVVQMLLEKGADTSLRNNYGRTALESVAGDWGPEIKGMYEMFGQALQIPVDLDRMKEMRPQVAELIGKYDS